MSYKVVRHVLEKSQTKGAQRLILLVIAEHADESGISWPSIETIARLANCSTRYVQRTIRNLNSEELIIDRGGGRSRSNRYRIPLEKVNPSSLMQDPERVKLETERVNSDAQNSEPLFTRTIKNQNKITIKNNQQFRKEFEDAF